MRVAKHMAQRMSQWLALACRYSLTGIGERRLFALMPKKPKKPEKSKKPKKQPLSAREKQQRTLRAHQRQLDSIAGLVQRELIRGGVLCGPPRDNWKLDDAYPIPKGEQPPGTVPLQMFLMGTKIDANAPSDPNALTTVCPDALPSDWQEGATLELKGRRGAVLGAALLVQDSLAKAHGLLHQAAELMRLYGKAADDLNAFLASHSEELVNRLRTSAFSDAAATYGSECTALDFTAQVQFLNAVGVGAATRCDAALRFARSLEERVLAESAVYEETRHGPNMHLLAMLDRLGLDDEQIADFLGALPDRHDPQFAFEMDWEDACTKSKRNVAVRVRRAKKKLGTRDPESRVPLDQRVLVLFCRYVQPGQPISLHIRSGPGVSDADRERAPMDQDGTPPQRPSRP